MQHVDSETVAIQKLKVYYIELRMLHRCTHSAFVFEEICDRFDVMSERRNRWNSNRNGIDTLDDDDDGDVAQHVCLCLAHGIWLVYEHMNRLFTPFCNVNYAFIAATMNPQCICSTTQSIYSGWLVCLAAIHLRAHLSAAEPNRFSLLLLLFQKCAWADCAQSSFESIMLTNVLNWTWKKNVSQSIPF